MAKISGFKCDGPGCAKTIESQAIPVGWMTLTVRTVVLGRRDNPDDIRDDFHLCSNRCLKRLSTERYRAAVERGDEEGSYYAERKKKKGAA